MVFSGIAALGHATGRSDLAHAYDNLLRLHVLAHSDRPEDQSVKLLVRDALIRDMAGWPQPADRNALEALLVKNRARLESVAEETLRREGFSHDVRVEIGDFEFPDKRSGSVFLPAGRYRAVRVVIGDGAGHNWWCVLFPPLCFVDESPTGSEASAGPNPRIQAANRLAWAAEARTPDTADQVRRGDASSDVRIASSDRTAPGAVPSDTTQVRWRLRIWESLSESVYADALRGLIQVASGREQEQ